MAWVPSRGGNGMSGISQKLMMTAAGAGGVLPLADFFSADLYTGSASSVTVTNGIDLAAGGLLWVKRLNADSTLFFDSARIGTGYRIMTPPQDAELNIGGVTFNSTGYILDPSNTANYPANNGQPYVAYSFKEAPKLFDIVTYVGNGVSGRAIPHNLGAEPSLIFVKNLTQAVDWAAWARGVSPQSSTYSFTPTSAAAWGDTTLNIWGSVSSYTFDSSVFTVGDNATTNANGKNYVAYVFANSSGPLKVGSYTGNGTSQVIDLGFSTGVRFLLIKGQGGSRSWYVFDSVQTPAFPGADPNSRLNVSGAISQYDDYIFADPTGFGVNAPQVNGVGETFIYMAIGE